MWTKNATASATKFRNPSRCPRVTGRSFGRQGAGTFIAAEGGRRRWERQAQAAASLH